jgi:hypothetical protein
MMRPDRTSADIGKNLLETGIEATMLAIETNLVVVYRALGLMGFRPITGQEVTRMIAEKPPAFAASALAAGLTAFGGQRPDQVMAAAIHPLRTETNRNVRRLGGDTIPPEI